MNYFVVVQEVHTVTFEIKRDVVEEKLDEWMQVCTSHEQWQVPLLCCDT